MGRPEIERDRLDETERSDLLQRMALHAQALERALLPEAAQSLLTTELTFQQLKVLTLLLTQVQDSTVGALAEALGVSRASMSTMVDRLAAAGTVTRDVDDDDHRVRHVHVTPLGRSVVRRLVMARPEYGQDRLERLGAGDLRALERGVRALVVALDAAGLVERDDERP